MQQMSVCYTNVNSFKAYEQDFPFPDMGAEGLPHLHGCVCRSVVVLCKSPINILYTYVIHLLFIQNANLSAHPYLASVMCSVL